jgi:hypothetical protein
MPRPTRPEGRASAFFLLLALASAAPGLAQDDPLVVRPGPPASDDLETDSDGDQIPDGWYNFRDAAWADGGHVGPHCIRMENRVPGLPARASRAFGIDGRKAEALVVGLWVRVQGIGRGEREGEAPGLIMDMLGAQLRAEARGSLGPWSDLPEGQWVRVSRRLNVPVGTRDAIFSVGLFGATGVLEVDGLTFDLVPRTPERTTELILNGGLELGDPDPAHWNVAEGARRAFPGHRSDSALELDRAGAMAQAAVAVPVARLGDLEVRLMARGANLRGSGGATAEMYFVDEAGEPLRGASAGVRLARFGGSFDWREFRAVARVPVGASAAVLQLEKTDSTGSIKIDDVSVRASPDPSRGEWAPYHVATETDRWHPYEPAGAILAGSALDASTLLDAPAGKHGFVRVEGGRFAFERGGPARFSGVVLLPPLGTLEPGAADALADDLARRGVNLARFDDLDGAFGPGRSLIDDASPDTRRLDPEMLARFDHLVAALKARGIYLSVELMADRLLRQADPVPGGSTLPPGGGPALGFEPKLRELAVEFARALLGHVNPETGLALKDDPALAWVVISGEQSLFDLIDRPGALSPESAEALRKLGSARRHWQALESAQWEAIAGDLRELGVRVPIAGASHWRREADFNAAQAAKGLDAIDDRLYWPNPRFALPERRSQLWDPRGDLRVLAKPKRRPDRAYAVAQWCAQTDGAWASPFEAADMLLMAETAASDGWDALVRRGVFLRPEPWGAAATGTSGGDDVARIPEVLNANPAAFAMLPHASSIVLRGGSKAEDGRGRRLAAWDPASGRLVVATPHTHALAGWAGRRPATFEALTIESDSPYAAVAVSSLGPEPIAEAGRLLVTAVARVEPTGLRYVDGLHHEVADPGHPPLLVEPVRARVTWKRRGTVRAFALDNAGKRLDAVPLERDGDGVRLEIDGRIPSIHWELVVDGAGGGP